MCPRFFLLTFLVLPMLMACAANPTAAHQATVTPKVDAPPRVTPALMQPTNTLTNAVAEVVPDYSSEWRTDFAKFTVPLNQIISGGPPKGGIGVDAGICALFNPKFISSAEASLWLPENEPVILWELNGDVRAYPIQILIWHEIANDVVGGVPVVITYCPLCNSAIVFERTVAGERTAFGTTGRLHYSDLVMYDSTTESWWQQLTGDAIVGARAGMKLTILPSQVIAFDDFKTRFADGKVLSRDTGMSRRYGINPYTGYDSSETPFLYAGPPTPKGLKPHERVVIVQQEQNVTVYAYSLLAQEHVVNDLVRNQPVVIFWKAGTASPLDTSNISAGRDIGATGVFDPRVDGRPLTFEARDEKFLDRDTQSVWDITGRAIGGALQGKQLTPLVHGDFFWFAWAAFRPDSKIYQPATP